VGWSLTVNVLRREHPAWRFLLAFKSAAQNVPRMSLVTEMLKNSDASRFVTSLLPDAITGGYAHRTLLAFNASTLHDFVVRAQSFDEGTMAYLLPALLEPLLKNFAEFEHLRKDAIVSFY
jgi:U3 small nucleolar RNA-associated protein 10